MSHDLALYNDNQDHSTQPYDARLIQISLDDACQFTMQGQTAYQLTTNASSSVTDPLVALVIPNSNCPMVLHTLFANLESRSSETKAILSAVSVLVFSSLYSSDYDIGGINESEFQFYKDALPFDVDDLMAIGSDGADTLRQALTNADDQGVPIHVVHDKSPWDVYYHSTTWAGIRWSFFVANLIAVLYVGYHIGITFVRQGFAKDDRYWTRIACAVFLMLHLIFYMACPAETATTRLNALVRRLSIGTQTVAYSLLIMQWARVVARIFNWRYMRLFYRFSIFMVGYTLLFTILIAIDVYLHQSARFAAFIMVYQNIINSVCIVIELVALVYSAILISRTQWAQRKNGAGPMALVKLTYLVNISCLGYIVYGLIMVLEATIWRPPRISYFIASTVFAQVFSFITAAAIFWTLAAASKVRSDISGPTSDARRRTTTRSVRLDELSLRQQKSHEIASSRDSSLPLGTDLEHLGNSISEKPQRPLSHPHHYTDEDFETSNVPMSSSWHDPTDGLAFQPDGPNSKILL
ncbi:hypothetical protein IWQ60_005564 [Tieghemiomyces parasiticus]|uniref:Uncharacterized protein n=1 Tax=Tieghemiomyces parasiticus TaxID=78921 RepID=A0A9W8AC48_9FUNG|nr:hypothetical protein IWQ60_005564 [Tieghemiomyces parasiticus]